MARGTSQAKSTAQKRVNLAAMANQPEQPEETTIDGVLAGLAEHVSGAIATLGLAAANGDVQAAKAILDWVKSANAEKQSTKGQDMLDRIQRIREAEANGPAS